LSNSTIIKKIKNVEIGQDKIPLLKFQRRWRRKKFFYSSFNL